MSRATTQIIRWLWATVVWIKTGFLDDHMDAHIHSLPPAPAAPLAGRRAWLITDGKVGMDVQVRGVADALGLQSDWKRVDPQGIWRLLSPYGPVAPSEQFGSLGSPFAPPFPDFVLATGRLSIPYARAVKRAAGATTFSVILQDPKTSGRISDLIWVPEHDRRRGANVITTLTAPHSFTAMRLADLRAAIPSAIAALPGPRVTVILGGKNAVYKFTDACDDRLEASLASLAALGVSFMITPSRRTHPRLLAAVDRATANSPRILWANEGPNPYPDFLAHADALVVTADSVNMCGEAAATGRPVYIFHPARGSPKFERFHAGLVASGATRPLPATFDTLERWSYRPLQAADQIATAIVSRWQAGRS
jgi:uncharacterized protein